jgi:hypothetical protein
MKTATNDGYFLKDADSDALRAVASMRQIMPYRRSNGDFSCGDSCF